MNAAAFQSLVEPHLDALRTLVRDHMKEDGLKEEDSQRICVLNRLNQLEYAINGIEDTDIRP